MLGGQVGGAAPVGGQPTVRLGAAVEEDVQVARVAVQVAQHLGSVAGHVDQVLENTLPFFSKFVSDIKFGFAVVIEDSKCPPNFQTKFSNMIIIRKYFSET